MTEKNPAVNVYCPSRIVSTVVNKLRVLSVLMDYGLNENVTTDKMNSYGEVTLFIYGNSHESTLILSSYARGMIQGLMTEKSN